MAWIEKTIEVDVPLLIAYRQWTQFEEFSEFMADIKEVRQLDHKRLHWHAEVMGKQVDWFAEITEQIPGKRITWRNLSGAKSAGGVSFQSLGVARTRVTWRVEYEPTGPVEPSDSVLGFIALRIDGDLRRFKQFIEERGHAQVARRGVTHGAHVPHPSVP